MSAQLPENPKPAEPPAVNQAAKISDKLITLFGGALFVAGLIAGRLLKKDDPDAAEAWGDGLKGFGFVCAMVGGAISIPLLSRLAGVIGGKLLTALVIGGVLAAGGSVLPGCATSDSGSTLAFRLRPDPNRPPPACLYELQVDGRTLHKGPIDVCPVVPACEETSP